MKSSEIRAELRPFASVTDVTYLGHGRYRGRNAITCDTLGAAIDTHYERTLFERDTTCGVLVVDAEGDGQVDGTLPTADDYRAAMREIARTSD